MGCDSQHAAGFNSPADRIQEAIRIRRRVLACRPEPTPNMMTLEQLGVWLEVYTWDGKVRTPQYADWPTKEQLKALKAIERRFYP